MDVYFSLPHYKGFKAEQSKFDTYSEKYRYIDLDEVKKAEKELKDFYGISSQEEYSQAFVAISRLENEDLQKFQREITPNYTTKFLAKYPQEFNITKTMYVTLLPNGKTQWVVPTFYVHELNKEFLSNGNTIFIPEITLGKQTQEFKNQMDIDLLKKTLVISNEDKAQYAAYLNNHCDGDPCLVIPTVDFYFGEFNDEGDDWDN